MANDENKIILEFPATSIEIDLGETITFDNISGFLNSDRVTVDGDTLTEKLSAMDSEIGEKADSDDVYDKTYIDNAFTGVNNSLATKMDKANPTGTGSFSLNRKAGTTVGYNSVAIGNNNEASGTYSFAEGNNTTASGSYSHAEGIYSTASASSAHAEGIYTTASGQNSHAEGIYTTASGQNSHAEGYETTASRRSQHVFGEWNEVESGNSNTKGTYVEIVGNGRASYLRGNARTLDWQGNETLAGDLTINGNQSVSGEITRLDGRIDNLPAPMIFKGTLGVGGTIQSLPTASASNEGWTYKVITDGTYAGQTAKVGDVFTSNGSAWVLIPSGDEDNDTWRAIKVNGVEKLGNGISSGAVDFEDTTNVKFTFDSNGNKVKATLSGIYTSSEVNDLLDDKADADNTYTKEQVDDIVYNILPDDTASGSVANFNTSLELPLKSLEIDVNAVQSAGTPTPATPLPISGWSEISLTKCGVNLWDEETENGYLSSSDGSFISHANSICSKNYRLINPSAQVYVATSTDKTLYICWYDENKAFISRAVCGNTSVTSPLNARYFKLSCYNYGSTYNNDTSVNYPSNDTTYHAYNANTEVINLGGTCYGGHFTQDKDGHRQFEVTHALFEKAVAEMNNSDAYPGWKDSGVKNIVGADLSGNRSGLLNIGTNYALNTTESNDVIYLGTGSYGMTQSQWIANYPDLIVQVLLPYAEPYIIVLSNGEPINTIAGTNNFFADTGDSTVVFKCSVNDYVSAHSGGNLLGLGGVYLGGAKSGGSEEEPTEESEDTEKVKLDETKVEVKEIGDKKKLGGEDNE